MYVSAVLVCAAAWAVLYLWPVGAALCLQCRRPGFNPWVGKIPWRRKWQSTPVLLPVKSHGQRSLAGCSPWDCKESDTTERIHFTSLHFKAVSKSGFWALILVVWANIRNWKEEVFRVEVEQRKKYSHYLLILVSAWLFTHLISKCNLNFLVNP